MYEKQKTKAMGFYYNHLIITHALSSPLIAIFIIIFFCLLIFTLFHNQ